MSGSIARSRLLGRLGLILMFGTAGLFLRYGPECGYWLPVLSVFGAGLALGARIRGRQLQRGGSGSDSVGGLGGYPFEMLRRSGLPD